MAELLKKARIAENMTQRDLAIQANVPQSIIGRIEGYSDKRLPRVDVYVRILSFIGYKTYLGVGKGKKIFGVIL